MSVFYREGYTVLEMEAGPYLSAIYELVNPQRHPDDEIVHLSVMAPFDVGILHYASDTPYSRRQSLLSKSLSFFGVESTSACAIAICRQIFTRELATPARPLIAPVPDQIPTCDDRGRMRVPRRHTTPGPSPSEPSLPPTDPTRASLRQALHAALTAPSPGNSQPWRILLLADETSTCSPTPPAPSPRDPDGQQRILAGGAALGLLRVALRALGLAEHTDILPGDHPDLLARVTLTGSVAPTPEETWLLQAAPKRRTHRGPFAARPVRESLLQRLCDLSKETGADLLPLHRTSQRDALAAASSRRSRDRRFGPPRRARALARVRLRPLRVDHRRPRPRPRDRRGQPPARAPHHPRGRPRRLAARRRGPDPRAPPRPRRPPLGLLLPPPARPAPPTAGPSPRRRLSSGT
jgi:hypothetical protein